MQCDILVIYFLYINSSLKSKLRGQKDLYMKILGVNCLERLLCFVLTMFFWQGYGQIPSCTSLSSPANGATDIALDVDFEWNAAVNATDYSIVAGTSSGAIDIIDHADVGGNTSYNLPVNLPANTTIFVSIITSNANGENTSCTEISFTTSAETNTCPELLLPIEGAVDVPLNTIIEWTAVEGAFGYRITIGSSSGTNDILDNFDVGNATSYQLPGGFSVLTSVFMSIIPYDGSSSGLLCSELRFTTTSGVVPRCTQIINPQDGALLVAVNANITWIRDFTATGYLMTIREKEPDGAFILNEEDVGNGTNYKPPNFEPRTKYYITMIPYNAQGRAVGCQAIVISTGDPLPLPDCAESISPNNGAVAVQTNTALEWEAIANADGYFLSVGTSLNETDLLNKLDVGLETSYNLMNDLPIDTKIYWQVNTYEGADVSEGCPIFSFTTIGLNTPELLNNIPKFFTPNNDGFNDNWAVNALNDIEIQQITIFDRFGKLIKQFSSNQHWDGTLNGKALPSDSYWYAIEFANASKITGFFALKR